MVDEITRLIRRYGLGPDYDSLSQRQKDLLLDPSISTNTDGCGLETLTLHEIKKEGNKILLDLWDVHSYLFHRNAPASKEDYALSRLPLFKKALNINIDPVDLGYQTYLFHLSTISEIKVQYFVVKDRV